MRRRFIDSVFHRHGVVTLLLALTFLAGWGPRVRCVLGFSCQAGPRPPAAETECCCPADRPADTDENRQPPSHAGPCDCDAACCSAGVVIAGDQPVVAAAWGGGRLLSSVADRALPGRLRNSIFHPPRA
jgi:hypothetical protein